MREHETLSSLRTVETPEETIEEVMGSPLEGTSVVFLLDDEGWSAELPEDSESEIEQDLLDDLRADLELVGLLPTEEVAEGDTWEVGRELYLSLNWLGGMIPWTTEGEEDDRDPLSVEGSRQRFASAEAEGEATLASVEDGVATIAVTLEGWSSSSVDVEFDADELEHVDSITREQTVDVEMEIEVLWDLEEGRWTSFTITDHTSATMDEVIELVGPEGQELQLIDRRSYENDIEVEATND